MSALTQLDAALKAVAPVLGVSSDGTINFAEGVTDEQRAAAETARLAFVPVDEAPPLTLEVLAKTLTDAKVITVEALSTASMAASAVSATEVAAPSLTVRA